MQDGEFGKMKKEVRLPMLLIEDDPHNLMGFAQTGRK